MVTLVILSLGLLGLAGLQLTGLKNNRAAYYQTVAAQLTQDLAERIKADQAGAQGASYDGIIQAADNTQCAVNAPTVTQRAACLAAALPGGQARVTKLVDCVTKLDIKPKSFLVALRWTDLDLAGSNGWGADQCPPKTPTFATSACGAAVAGTNCYYTLVMP